MASASRAVTWRQAFAALVATACCLTAFFVVFRSDGLPAVDAASSRATRWVVHQPTGRAVLVDGFGGRALASVEVGAAGDDLLVAEGSGQTYLLNDSSGEVRSIDSAELRLGPPQGIAALGSGNAVARSGSSGLLVANPLDGTATLLPAGADAVEITFDADRTDGVSTGDTVALARDGSVWSLSGGSLERSTAGGTTTEALGIAVGPDGGALSLVGNRPLVLDREGQRARLGSGAWQDLPSTNGGSEYVLQEPGPQSDCGWVGVDDQLWCIDEGGIVEEATVPGLDIDGSSALAIAGDAAALVRRGPTEVVQFDWRSEEIIAQQPITFSSDASLVLTSTVDVVWIDDTEGDFVWTVHPWGIQEVEKDGDDLLVLGEEGAIIDEGESGAGQSVGADDGVGSTPEVPEADENGVDDPPEANDDQARARSGNSVQVAVTANDFDPDGEAIAVVKVGTPGHGSVEIGTASTVVFVPTPGYVGLDQFEYTISDGNGNEDTATVFIEMLSADAANRAPVGAPDNAVTGPGVDVVIEVLLNDVDPERDSLRIDLGAADVEGGTVEKIDGPSGAPAVRFTPTEGYEGRARFSYRPVDVLGAVGEDVQVFVEVARLEDENRPPVVRPDAIRIRRDSRGDLPVLVNDTDPDGDPLLLTFVEPLPDGLGVTVSGDQLAITPRAGSGSRVPFQYEVDDGNGHVVRGWVLVVVIDDAEPNRPPIVSPDLKTAVVGQSILIDVTANDSDPDGDPLVVVAVTQPEGRGTVTVAGRNRVEFTPTALQDVAEAEANARFTYTVTDGNDHEVVGDVTVTVLPEALPEPPYAQDDSTFTFMNEPVTIDVLRNDGDPSGERPVISGRPGCPAGGVATVTAVGQQVRFDPPRDETGAFRCTYQVTNSRGLVAEAAIIISVRERVVLNEPPETENDTELVEIGGSVSVDVAANDTDPDGSDAALRVTSSTQPVIGSAVRNGNVITFTAGNVTGVATMTYTVEDEQQQISKGRFQVIVTEIQPKEPVARPDTNFSIPGPGVPTLIDVLSNDSDEDGAPGSLRIQSVTMSSGGGTASIAGGGLINVSPDPDFVGVLAGTYTIVDTDGLTDSAAFSLEVREPINRPPVAVDDSATVVNGGSITVPVLFNDSDPDGDDELGLTIVGGPDPSLGTATVTSNQSILFAAVPGRSGTAVVNYEVSDGELTDSATLRIQVQSCTQSTPVASDAFLETGYQQPINVNLANFAQGGVITEITGPSTYQNNVYTPPAGTNGNVTIGFAVVNDCRQRATGTITIDVNQDPVGQSQTLSLVRGETREIPVAQMATDDESLTITGADGAPGWVTTSPSRIVIAPTQAVADGTYSWSLFVSDPGGLTATIAVSVTITNQVPKANPDAIDVSAGTAVGFDLVANDVDPDGANSSLRVQSVPSAITFANGEKGSVQLGPDGRTVTVDPAAGTGQGTFEYTVVDASGAVSPTTTVTVTGPAANGAPVANDQAVTVTIGVQTPVTLNASDPDGDPITVEIIDDQSNVLLGQPDGLVIRVSPSAPGEYIVTYDVVDSRGAVSGTATLTITATPPATTTTTTTPPTTTTPTTTTPTTTTTTTPGATTVPPTTSPPTSPPTSSVTTTTTAPPGPPGPPGPPDGAGPPGD